MSQEKQHNTNPAGVSPLPDPVAQIWKLEEQVREQLRRGVRVLGGAVVAASVGSSSEFVYAKKYNDELIIKYIDGCVAVTANSKLIRDEVKVYDVTIHNICSRVDI